MKSLDFRIIAASLMILLCPLTSRAEMWGYSSVTAFGGIVLHNVSTISTEVDDNMEFHTMWIQGRFVGVKGATTIYDFQAPLDTTAVGGGNIIGQAFFVSGQPWWSFHTATGEHSWQNYSGQIFEETTSAITLVLPWI